MYYIKMDEKLEKQWWIENKINEPNAFEKIFRNKKKQTIMNMIRSENNWELWDLLKERKCKIQMLFYINILQYLLLIFACIMSFLSTWFSNKSLNESLAISWGCCNVVYLWLDSIKKNIYKWLVSVKQNIEWMTIDDAWNKLMSYKE